MVQQLSDPEMMSYYVIQYVFFSMFIQDYLQKSQRLQCEASNNLPENCLHCDF